MLRLPTENTLDREENIMAEWITTTLEECTDILGDGLHGTPKYTENGEYAFVNGNNLVDGEILIKKETKRVDYSQYDKYKKPLTNRTILVSINGTLGNVGVYGSEKIILGKSACYFNVKESVDKDFIYYIVSSPTFKQYLESNATGTTIKNISLKQMREYTFELPEIGEQKRISSVLRKIDEKIKNNRAINNNLEQQAQAIFKEWFIDNPENNEWSTGTFSELIKSTLNGDWGKEAPTGNNTEKVYCIRGADIPEVKAGNKGKMPTRYILPKNFAAKQLAAGDIVVEISGGSPTQSTGRCTAITQSLLDRYDSGMVCTNFCKAMKPKEGYSLFIYYYWQYLYGKGVFFSYENGTTGIKNLDFSGFIETETILIPPVDKIIAFDDYCKSIFNQIFANGKQNEHLAVLRDTLLPKLMSGELDVSDMDL